MKKKFKVLLVRLDDFLRLKFGRLTYFIQTEVFGHRFISVPEDPEFKGYMEKYCRKHTVSRRAFWKQ